MRKKGVTTSKNADDAEIIIYDIIGARRKSIKIENRLSGKYQKRINLAGLSSGVYFVVLEQNNEKVSKKFLLVE